MGGSGHQSAGQEALSPEVRCQGGRQVGQQGPLRANPPPSGQPLPRLNSREGAPGGHKLPGKCQTLGIYLDIFLLSGKCQDTGSAGQLRQPWHCWGLGAALGRPLRLLCIWAFRPGRLLGPELAPQRRACPPVTGPWGGSRGAPGISGSGCRGGAGFEWLFPSRSSGTSDRGRGPGSGLILPLPQRLPRGPPPY